jgi:hypothetical protein
VWTDPDGPHRAAREAERVEHQAFADLLSAAGTATGRITTPEELIDGGIVKNA